MKHIKMPKAIAEKWLADLRSGEYKQCIRKMTNGIGFCCLGVLQMGISGEVIAAETEELPQLNWLYSKNIEFFNEDGGKAKTPYCAKREEFFSTLNDRGVPFPEIADLLEDEIEYNDK